jgi:Tfp pilus assembly PilM family ATPase
MAWLLGRNKNIITGFDISATQIHVMQAAANKNAFTIHELRTLERSLEPFAGQLPSILSSLPHKVRTAAITLPVEDTVFHPLLLPPLQEKDLCGFVKYEMAKQLETGAEHVSADFTFCDAGMGLHGDTRRAIGFGIKKKTVETLLQSFERHQIRVLFAEAGPMALLNAVYACHPHLKQKTVMGLNLQIDTISVVIAVNGYPAFIRKIPAKPIYLAIEHRDEMNAEHPILKEIKRTLLYCQTHIQRVELETVLLTGNGCDVSDIESQAQESLPFSLKPFNILNCASDRIQLHLPEIPLTQETGLPMANAAGLLFRMSTGDS